MNRAVVGASTIAAQLVVSATLATGVGDLRWVVSGLTTQAAVLARAARVACSCIGLAQTLGDPDVSAADMPSINEKHHVQTMAAIVAGTRINLVRGASSENIVRNFPKAEMGTPAPAVAGRDGAKSQQISDAVRRAAPTRQRPTVGYGEIG